MLWHLHLRKVFKWLKSLGGLEAMKEDQRGKGSTALRLPRLHRLLYGYRTWEDRSIMNVPFVTASAELDAEFVAGAKERGIENIKGAIAA